jgi:uncharacterized OsmC-like protein
MTAQTLSKTINGVVPSNLLALSEAVQQDSNQGEVAFQTQTTWIDGAHAKTHITAYDLGQQRHHRDFTFDNDEPEQLGGKNLAPAPPEYLLAGLNGCILTTFVYLASLQGIRLHKVEVSSQARLNLTGFFGFDPEVPPGFKALTWTLTVKADATDEQLQALYEATQAASPNLWNLMNPVNTIPNLHIEA